MKLIIDIPEELVEKEHFYTEEELWTVIRAAENGTPFDDVKAEIDQLPLVLLAGNYHIDKDYVMEILDRIGRK